MTKSEEIEYAAPVETDSLTPDNDEDNSSVFFTETMRTRYKTFFPVIKANPQKGFDTLIKKLMLEPRYQRRIGQLQKLGVRDPAARIKRVRLFH